MALYSETDFIHTWDHCSPYALLARAIIRENRAPTALELEALNCAGFAGEEGNEIDEESVARCIDIYMKSDKGKLTSEDKNDNDR